MIITFLGHRLVPPGDRLIPRIKNVLLSRIGDTDEVTFYCGGYGDFDRLCAQVCRSIKKDRGHCELVYITPYITEAQQKKIAARPKQSAAKNRTATKKQTAPKKQKTSPRRKG